MKRSDPARPEAQTAALEAQPGKPLAGLPGKVRELLANGRAIDAQDLLQQHPDWRNDKSLVLDLAYEEYCQRLEGGETVDLAGFCGRFRGFQSSLRRLLGVHQFLEENPHWLAGEGGSWPEPGQEFLGYILIRELGRGTFARVFLATEPALGGRQVAVKVSRLGTGEAQTLGRLGHANIVPIHSVQTDPRSGFTAVCMPYLGNATLVDLLDRAFSGPHFPQSGRILESLYPPTECSQPRRAGWGKHGGSYIDEILRIGSQLAEALAFAHRQGICHRDLKPSNVLLAQDGRPMLLDFNLSFDECVADNRLGGTLPYMAPEQLLATDPEGRTDPGLLDARSDLYSLGVILYELLTGRHPFASSALPASTREARKHLLEQQRHGAPSLRTANPHVDRRLARSVESCLAYNPAQRPQTAGVLALQLRRSLRWRRRAIRWVAGHRRTVAVSAVVVMICGALAAYGWSQRDPYPVREWHSGQASYRQGNYREAVEHYNHVLETEAASARVLFARGRAYQQRGDWTLALADFQGAYSLSDDGASRACAGYCLCRLEQDRPAALYFQRAIELGFAPPEVLNNLGYCWLSQAEPGKTRTVLNQAIELNPGLQMPFYNRALLSLHEALSHPGSDTSMGLSDVRRALELGPPSSDMLRYAASLSALAGEQELALARLQRAVEMGLDPRPLRSDRSLRSLYKHPRFHELIREAGSAPLLPPTKTIRVLDPIPDAAPIR